MFTGIVTDVGRVRAVRPMGDTRIEIACGYDAADIEVGASVACAGVCLTVVERGADENGAWFGVDASAETLRATTLGGWRPGTPVNLERALKVGDELGGHIVSGHVDGVGVVESLTPEGDSLRFVFEAPETLAPYLAPKGSVAVDGVSLTINGVEGNRFSVNVIPHTRRATTLRQAERGAQVNLEVDLLARYVERLLRAGRNPEGMVR
ncbi:MAG: riboflavin synthase [Alphaproteobacteria bacterium]